MTQLHRPQSAVHLGMDIRQMYDTHIKNYEWQGIKYQLPKKYAEGIKKPILLSRPITAKRSNYLNQLYTVTKHVPGVGKYQIVKPRDNKFIRKIKSSERKTFIDDIFETNSRCKSPGPGSYLIQYTPKKNPRQDPEEKQREKINYLDQCEYQAATSPGVGQYQVSTTLLKKSFNTKKPKIQKGQKTKLKKEKKSEKLLINPIFDKTFEQMQKQPKGKSNLSKQHRFKSIDQNIKFPGSTTYKINMEWNDKSHHILKRISKPLTRSIYY